MNWIKGVDAQPEPGRWILHLISDEGIMVTHCSRLINKGIHKVADHDYWIYFTDIPMPDDVKPAERI